MMATHYLDPAARPDSILCGLCRRDFRALSNTHLVRFHGFDPEHPIVAYKKRFGVQRAESEDTRSRQIRSLERTWERQGKRWSRERVRCEILQRVRRKEPLNAAAVKKSRQHLIWTARKHYGSWDRALDSAGVNPGLVRRRIAWNRETILARLRQLRNDGQGLSWTALDRRLAQAARRAFGSLDQAIVAAGFEPDSCRRIRRWTPSLVLQEIRRLDRVAPAVAVRKTHPALFDAARRRWRTWSAALAAAGRADERRWTSEEILDEIRHRAEQGLALRAGFISRRLTGLWRASRVAFGSWGRALRAAFGGDRSDPRTVRDLIFHRFARICSREAVGTRAGVLPWTDAKRRLPEQVETRACAYCRVRRGLSRASVVPRSMNVKAACARCPKLRGTRNQVWACGGCRAEKGDQGLYTFLRRRFPEERTFYSKIPAEAEKKYLGTIYDCHRCAGTLDATDADGDGELTVRDLEAVLGRGA
jgi:hypothetical protein